MPLLRGDSGMNREIVSPEKLAALKEQRSQLAVKHGLPPLGAKMVNQYGIEWVVGGHIYMPDLTSLARDKGQLVPEHPRDLMPMISPQNLSPRLLEFLSELDRCTSRELIMLDTVPYLRPQQAHSDGHWVDHWADPDAICFFFDASHIHETIIAHEVAHIWIDLVGDCEDARLMRDLSDTAKVRQVLYIQSFVLDRKVNEVIEARGFDTSIIASHQWDAVNWMAQKVAKGHQPATKREAVFSALTIAATLWEQAEPIKADLSASDSLQDCTELGAALAALRQGVPVIYALAQDFAAAVRKHGYNSRAQLRNSIDECLRLAFEFSGEEFSIEKELVEIPPIEPDVDKWPKYFLGWPPVAKREIGKLMAQNKIRVGNPVRLASLPTGQFSVSFLDQQGKWTPQFVLQHAPDFLPQSDQLPIALPERNFGVQTPRLNPAFSKLPLPRSPLTPRASVPSIMPSFHNFTRHNLPMAQGRRNYMPGVGRWLSRDPLGFEGGDTNLYRYVANNPVNDVDPSGLATDPAPGTDKIRIVFNAFIPTPYARALPGDQGYVHQNGLKGDNRGYSPNGGTYRVMHTIVINPKTGKATAWDAPGVSHMVLLGQTLPPSTGTGSLCTQVNSDKKRGGWNIHIQGSALVGYIIGKVSPSINYSMQLHVSPKGAVSFYPGHIDGYPAYELWAYNGKKMPLLVYGQMPNSKFGSVMNLINDLRVQLYQGP
jgi:RHS repeat-associated protein